MAVLTQLSREHESLRTHIERTESAADTRDTGALLACLAAARAALTDELDAHMAVEETEAFSAISEGLGEDLVAPFYQKPSRSVTCATTYLRA